MSVGARLLKPPYFRAGFAQQRVVPSALYEVLVCERNKVDAPKADKFFLRQATESVCKSMKHWVAWRLNAMGNNHFSMLQKIIRQKVDKDPKERAFSRTLCPWDEIDSIVQKVRECGRFDSGSFEQCVFFRDRVSKVKAYQQAGQ